MAKYSKEDENASIQVLRLPNRVRYKGMSEESLQTAAICVLLAPGVSHPRPAHQTFPVQHHLNEKINTLTIIKANLIIYSYHYIFIKIIIDLKYILSYLYRSLIYSYKQKGSRKFSKWKRIEWMYIIQVRWHFSPPCNSVKRDETITALLLEKI